MLGILVLQALIGIPLRQKLLMNVIRFLDNAVMVAVIFIFAYFKFDCKQYYCYDELQRNYETNPYVLDLLIMAMIGTVVSFTIYLWLYCLGIVQKGRSAMSEIKFVGQKNMDQRHAREIIINPLARKSLFGADAENYQRMEDANAHSLTSPRMGSHSVSDHESVYNASPGMEDPLCCCGISRVPEEDDDLNVPRNVKMTEDFRTNPGAGRISFHLLSNEE